MRRILVALFVSLCSPAPATAQIGISIGIDLPVFPQLVVVPGYPVYYAPQVDSNLFFFDGLYWVYARDGWYSSNWYNGPWTPMGPDDVPLYVLRVPVRYYRQPPAYFLGWSMDAAPRWGQHWGGDWERRHGGWDRWNHQGTPRPAPLPTYQREYAGDRYPKPERQRSLHDQHYQHQPRDPAVLRARQAQGLPGLAPSPRRQESARPARGPERREEARPVASPQRARPAARPERREESRASARDEGRRGRGEGSPQGRGTRGKREDDSRGRKGEERRSER